LEEGDEVPPLQGAASWERRLPFAGGTLDYGASVDGVLRIEEGTGEAARDVLRAGAYTGWREDRVLGYGMLVEAKTGAAVDVYRVAHDPAFEESLLRVTPAAALTLRWPLVRQGAGRIADLIEPVASIGWTVALGDELPNEDSRLPEFDETNLHAFSRLPGEDAVEEGGRLSLGLSWTRTVSGAASSLSVGRVFRTEILETSAASGLDGTASDWLVAGQIDLDVGLSVGARLLLDNDLSLARSEARLDWSSELVTLEAVYVRLPADRFENRPDRVEELSFEGEFRPSDRWAFRTEARYDLAREELGELGVGLTWRNECVEVDASLSRRYTSSDDQEPSTDFGLSVDLIGFSAANAPRVEPGACRG
jgi:LPS-assembly protein